MRLVRAPCWKQSTGYIPEDLQARHVKYVLNLNLKIYVLIQFIAHPT